MRRWAAAAVGLALLLAGIWWWARPATVPPPEQPAVALPEPTVDPAPAARPTPTVQPPVQPVEAPVRRLDPSVLLAEVAGLGRITCRLPEGVPSASGPGLRRPRVEDGWLFALVDREEGQAPLRAPGGIVGHVHWYDARPGQVGDCVTEPPREELEHALEIRIDGLPTRWKDIHRLHLTGCEGAGVPLEDGRLVVRALSETPCTVRVSDRKTGRSGRLSVDADQPSDLVLELDEVHPEQAGRSRTEVRRDELEAQSADARRWLAVLDTALDQRPGDPVLTEERTIALQALDELEALIQSL